MLKKGVFITIIFAILFISVLAVSASDNMTYDEGIVEENDVLKLSDEASVSDYYEDYSDDNYYDNYYYDDNYDDHYAEVVPLETYYNSGKEFKYSVEAPTWYMKIVDGEKVVYYESHTSKDGFMFSYDLKDLSVGDYKVEFYDSSYIEDHYWRFHQ